MFFLKYVERSVQLFSSTYANVSLSPRPKHTQSMHIPRTQQHVIYTVRATIKVYSQYMYQLLSTHVFYLTLACQQRVWNTQPSVLTRDTANCSCDAGCDQLVGPLPVMFVLLCSSTL